jgi:hypothetical protein
MTRVKKDIGKTVYNMPTPLAIILSIAVVILVFVLFVLGKDFIRGLKKGLERSEHVLATEFPVHNVVYYY